MKHRRSTNPFTGAVRLAVAAVIFAFGFAVLTTTAATATATDDTATPEPTPTAPIEVKLEPVKFIEPTCETPDGGQPTDAERVGYEFEFEYSNEVDGIPTTVTSVALADDGYVLVGDDGKPLTLEQRTSVHTYTTPTDCEPPVDRSQPVDRDKAAKDAVLPKTGASDNAVHDAATGMALGGIVLLCGLAIVRNTRAPRGRARHRA